MPRLSLDTRSKAPKAGITVVTGYRRASPTAIGRVPDHAARGKRHHGAHDEPPEFRLQPEQRQARRPHVVVGMLCRATALLGNGLYETTTAWTTQTGAELKA